MAALDAAATAQIAAARRAVKNALNQCRKASQRLAAAGNLDVYGQHTITRPQDLDGAVALIRLAHTEHPTVEVVVLTTTQPRPQQ